MSSQRAYSFRKKTTGFTLIEILVVIVIVSIGISVIVLNFSFNDESDLSRTESIRLQQLLSFAHDQAVIRGQEYGIRFYRDGYRFLIFDTHEQAWIPIMEERMLRPRQLPEIIELDLYIEQLSVELEGSVTDKPPQKDDADNKADDDVETLRPQVFLLSSTELAPPFELRLRIPGSNIESILQGKPQGEYTVTHHGS